jgi:hypothetical protein
MFYEAEPHVNIFMGRSPIIIARFRRPRPAVRAGVLTAKCFLCMVMCVGKDIEAAESTKRIAWFIAEKGRYRDV